ncbi:MAG: hypothetical protein KAU07_00255 [Candidatus Andersenbacteria bacterium]|nr:hypothetical protein [Candidatus Andersenbacteria bacterium]
MGIFSNIGDALSGKIYKQNMLVNNNIAELFEKSKQLSASKFIKDWAYSCILSSHVILNYLLFEKLGKGNEINTFKKNISKLNKEKVFEIIKLLVGHHLSAFRSNEENIEFLEKNSMDWENIKNKIFLVFSFNNYDKKIFQELDKEYDIDSAKYFLHLYQKIFEKAYEIPNEKNIFSSMLMASIISNTYVNVFIENLEKEIEDNY